MKRYLLGLLLVCGLFFTLAPASLAAEYKDVPADHWAAADIQAAKEAGILTGIKSTQFGLGRPINRAAFATALGRLFGWEPVEPTGTVFSDVAQGDWFAAAVETAAEHGAAPTYAKTFRPYDPITREEMVTMLIRGLGYNALAAGMEDSCPFTDAVTNKGYIALASAMDIVKGFKGKVFRPEDTATREQAAAVLARVDRRLNTPSVELTGTTGYNVLTIPTPRPTSATAVPTTPLEPIANLCTALIERKQAGADMSKMALVLTPGGWETVTSGGVIYTSRAVDKKQVDYYLNERQCDIHYADQYESGYLTVKEGHRTVTIWYQSPESMAAKLQLARLFGVTHYTC